MEQIELNVILKKAETYYRRGSFAFAIREYETAFSVSPTSELADKIADCKRELDLRNRKDLISRGHKHVKKKRYAEALDYFKKAAVIREEEWLQKKVMQLQNQIQQLHLHSKLNDIEKKDVKEKILIYNRLLDTSNDTLILKKKAACLVVDGRYSEAVQAFSTLSLTDDQALYYYGFALAKSENFLHALEHWSKINREYPTAFQEQFIELALLVVRKMQKAQYTHEEIKNAHTIAKRSDNLKPYLNSFRSCLLASLWAGEKYEEFLSLLPPTPIKFAGNILNIYAKLYLQLCIQSPEFIDDAISFFLTAIYNLKSQDMRYCLLSQFSESLLCVNKISTDTNFYWEAEKRTIEKLRNLIPQTNNSDILVCTPAFASRFQLSEQISRQLQKMRASGEIDEASYFQTAVYYSPTATAFILSEAGKVDEALAQLVKNATDEISIWCRRKICFRYAMKKLQHGIENGKVAKCLNQAIPLVEKDKDLQKELIDFVYIGNVRKMPGTLSNYLEKMCSTIKNTAFEQAAATCICIHAIELYNAGSISLKILNNMLKKALMIDPNCKLAHDTLTEGQNDCQFHELEKAFCRGNFEKASAIARKTDQDDIRQLYFELVEEFYDETNYDRLFEVRRKELLRYFLQQCCQLDDHHPIVLKIQNELN